MSDLGRPEHTPVDHQPTEQEQDLLQRSLKNVRQDNEGFTGTTALIPRVEDWMQEEPEQARKTYASMVRGSSRVGEADPLEDDLLEDEDNRMVSEEKETPTPAKDKANENQSNIEKSDITVQDMGEGLFNIVISEKIERELWKPWWRSLIVKLLGRKISYAVMKRRLEIMWGRFGGIDVIDLGNDFYLVKFYAQEDLDHALLDGPWKIYDHYLAVRLWEPNFNPLLTFIDKITAWIRLPGLPIELYNDKILKKIGDLIGKTCKVDYNTSNLFRGKFARLCVEVDLTKPLLGVYMINGKLYQIEYEGIHQLCFLCGRIDHEQK
ncbi:uncharacterized protein LOC127747666 [Arachis duranensis]|uniref:Uncharacterized protein LOC127747666 n=1 Tax=Arachis duranensis TaxID=130453 RepID=A0A9C6TJK6_ARADU|nr:uncharacterized protein LOC127747666 [Arachis duranensis]